MEEKPTQSRERGQGGNSPLRSPEAAPLVGFGATPQLFLVKSIQREKSTKGAGSEASLPVTSRSRRSAPKLLYPQLAYCRARWARPTSMGEGFLLMLVFFIAGEKRRAYPTAIEKPRQPLDNRPCVLPGLLCSWKMCYACSNCELYSSA